MNPSDRTDALAERPFAATLGALELVSDYLGSELADQAGYARADVLPIDNDFLRLYRLRP